MTEHTCLPVFLVVDEDPSTLDTLVSDLERRFAAVYRMVGESSAPAAAPGRLGALRSAGEQVALIISRESMQAVPGSELLARSRSTHPGAKRILLVEYGAPRMFDVVADPPRTLPLGYLWALPSALWDGRVPQSTSLPMSEGHAGGRADHHAVGPVHVLRSTVIGIGYLR